MDLKNLAREIIAMISEQSLDFNDEYILASDEEKKNIFNIVLDMLKKLFHEDR